MSIDKLKQAFTDIGSAINLVDKEVQELITNIDKIGKSLDKTQGIKELTTNINALNKARKEADTLVKQKLELQKKEEALTQAQVKTNHLISESAEKLIALNKKTKQEEAKLLAQRQKAHEARKKNFLAEQNIIDAGNAAEEKQRALSAKTSAEKQRAFEARKRNLLAEQRLADAKRTSEIKEVKEAERLVRVEQKKLKSSAKLTSAYARQSKALTLLRNRAKDLAIRFGENSNVYKQAEKRVVALDRKLKRLDSRLGQSQRKVGGYRDAFKGVGSVIGQLGVSLGAVQIGLKLFKGAISTTQTAGDKWAISVASVSGAIDGLFRTIGEGDWSNLIDNMIRGSKAAKELTKELDALFEKGLGADIQNVKIDLLIAQLERDRKIAMAQKDYSKVVEIATEINTKEMEKLQNSMTVAQDKRGAFFNDIKTLTDLSDKELITFLETYSKSEKTGMTDLASKYLEEFRKIEEGRNEAISYGLSITDAENAYKQETALLNDKYDNDVVVYAATLRAYNKLNDDKIQTAIEANNAIIKLEEQSIRQQMRNDVALATAKQYLDDAQIKAAKEKQDELNKEIEATADLIKEQEELLILAKEMDGSTEKNIRLRNDEIELIEKEISRLKELRTEKAPEQIDTTKINEQFNKAILDAGAELLEDQKALDDEEYEQFVKNEDKKTEYLKQAEEARAELKQQAVDLGIEIANGLFEKSKQDLADETEAITEEYDKRLAVEGLSEEQRSLIEAEREKKLNEQAKKERDLEKKQFLFGQGIKLAEIAIDTVQKVAAIKATAAVLAANPLTIALAPLALAQIPIAIGSGALAAGLVAAQTIPAFDKGIDNFPGLGWVAEKRPEFVVNNGVATLFDKPTLLGAESKGATVVGGSASADILTNMSRADIVNNSNNSPQVDFVNAQILGELQQMNKNNRKKQPIKIFNSSGINSSAHIGHSKLTKRLSGN